MASLMTWHKTKQVYSCWEPWMKGNRQCKFRTVVSEVLSFVGNPVTSSSSKIYDLNQPDIRIQVLYRKQNKSNVQVPHLFIDGDKIISLIILPSPHGTKLIDLVSA